MANIPGSAYNPPGVYTQFSVETPTQGSLAGLRLPVIVGTGSETMDQTAVQMVRGSSSQVDQKIMLEDETGRSVVSVSVSGAITLGSFDGVRKRVQTKHYPIVVGDGTGTTATKTSSIVATINDTPVVILSMNAATGLLELSTAPKINDQVRITYYYKRKDTLISEEDVSSQVTSDPAQITGVVGSPYSVQTGINDVLSLTVDGEDLTITLPDSGEGEWTASQVATFVNSGAGSTSLVASTTTNNYGDVVVVLTADQSLLIGDGSLNSTVGLSAGQETTRNAVFYTFNGPIVDGSNGGVTTTDPTDVTVTVDGVAVEAVAVDGASRAITLPYPPALGSTVKVSYYFNTWQDTYDDLPSAGTVLSVSQCGITAGRSDYVEGVDFILQDNRIIWGTAATVSSGEITTGKTPFGETQITTTLVDARTYLELCSAVVNSTVSPATESRTQFTLSLSPTTGNGRDTPLSSSTFAVVANGRVAVPTTRPDLVWAYWGYSVEDALARGRVSVTQVDGDVITLAEAVPVGANVYATYYYNTLVDQKYTLSPVTIGASGHGTYQIVNESGAQLPTPKFGAKANSLAGITLQFPSGSERKPDCRFETPFDASSYTGPVEETVTVTFRTTDSTPGEYVVPGSGDYTIIEGNSDHLRLLVDGADLAGGSNGITLKSVLGVTNLGFPATMVGDEVQYTAASSGTTYEVDATNNTVNLMLDGVLVQATVTPDTDLTLSDYVDAINAAAIDTPAKYVAAGKFNGSVVIEPGNYDQLQFAFSGDLPHTSPTLTIGIDTNTYASATLLAAQVQTQMQGAISSLIWSDAGFAGLSVSVTADSQGRLVFALTKPDADANAYLEFITHSSPSRDFAILAGIDTGATTGASQTKLLDGVVARRYTITGDHTGALTHDRMILRSRLVPGYGSVPPFSTLAYAGIQVAGSTGASNCGLTVAETAPAGWKGCVTPATLLGYVGYKDGQIANSTYSDARDGQPAVVFYGADGPVTQNNVFKFTCDGTPITVTFTDANGDAIASGAYATVPLGPASSSGTVLNQIVSALEDAGVSSATERCAQEGAAVRLMSALSTAQGSLVIGNGSANSVLGFAASTTATRTLVSAKQLASALMSFSHSSVADALLDWDTPESTYFAAEALATTVTDAGGSRYLYLQSQSVGTTSSVAFTTPITASILRPGTGLGAVSGDGGTGEAGVSGYTVTSTDSADGSGTANTSKLNDGVGQDGVVGQTYRDAVTGLTFTVLPRSGGSDYPEGSSFTVTVRNTVTTDSNLPINTLPGVELVVSNTLGVGSAETAIVETFEKGGSEPNTGDIYYVSYTYTKSDFSKRIYTNMADVERIYGSLSVDNPVTLGAYLAFLNGASMVGIKQVQKDTDSNGDGVLDTASSAAYIAALDDLQGPFVGNNLPDIIIPLKGDDVSLFQAYALHADVQSSVLGMAERTVIAGVSAGTEPSAIRKIAPAIGRTRFRLVYPDILYVSLPTAGGVAEEVIVDGYYAACALAGAVVAPSRDVAVPWTNMQLSGGRLGRAMTVTDMNLVAQSGVTVLVDVVPGKVKVRHGLTTDMKGASLNSIEMAKTPTVIQIMDYIQQQTRATLDPFVGTKNLGQKLSQVEGRVSMMLKGAVASDIIVGYRNVRATVDPAQPTLISVTAAIAPVFPLDYIVVSFQLNQSLK